MGRGSPLDVKPFGITCALRSSEKRSNKGFVKVSLVIHPSPKKSKVQGSNPGACKDFF